jgi:hypothetical protein
MVYISSFPDVIRMPRLLETVYSVGLDKKRSKIHARGRLTLADGGWK